MYDADILLSPKAIKKAVRIINSGIKQIILPFNNIFIDVKGDVRNKISETLDFEKYANITTIAAAPVNEEVSVRSVNGGIMIGAKSILMAEGGYNQKMISYGWEDSEFFKRFEKLGYFHFAFLNYSLVHLVHGRGPDSQQNEMYFKNKEEFIKVKQMTKNQLQGYVDSELNYFKIPISTKNSIRSKRSLLNILTLQKLAFLWNKSYVYFSIYGVNYCFNKYVLRKPVKYS